MSRVLIAGCEDLGCALGVHLDAQGHEIFGLERDGLELPPGFTVVHGDITKPSTLDNLPPDLDFVFHTVEIPEHDDKGYRAIYVDGGRWFKVLSQFQGAT